jgi:hydroxypyruvate isomerase
VRIGTYELAANVSLLFTEHDYLDRFAAAKAAGFTAVESWWPFPTASPSSAEVDAMLSAIEAAGVRLVGLNFFAGDMAAGERGVLSDPDRRDEFAASLAVVVSAAERTGCPVFNALYGQRRDGVSAAEQDDCARHNLTDALAALPASANVVLEALTVGENGEYPLTTADQVIDVITSVGGTNLAFLFDTYHLANNGEDLVATVRRHAAHIGHVQFADSPGRNEPGTGSVDFAAVIAELSAVGYEGVLAAEYRPKAATVDGLGWVPALGGA